MTIRNHHVVTAVLVVLGLLLLPQRSAQAELDGPVSKGKALVAELKARYESTVLHCGEAPAYTCSGIMIRGTRQNLPSGQGGWEPYPVGRTLDTSFTYLRQDIRAARLAWDYSNGFIINPPEELSVNCFFPLDGVSDERSDKGCGASIEHPARYSVCDIVHAPYSPITFPVAADYLKLVDWVAGLWVAQDVADHAEPALRCAYRLTDAYATRRFEAGLRAAVMASRTTDKPNDMKVQTWNPGYDPRLPVAAFFYVNEKGEPFARRDREKYLALTKIRVPLIKVIFPEMTDAPVKFEFVD